MCFTAPDSPSSKLISSNFAGIFGPVCVCCQAINYREGKEGRDCVLFSHTRTHTDTHTEWKRSLQLSTGRTDAVPSLILHLLFGQNTVQVQHENISQWLVHVEGHVALFVRPGSQ